MALPVNDFYSTTIGGTIYAGLSAGPSGAVQFTLTGPTSGITGSPSSNFTVTPDAALAAACTVNISAAGATVTPASLSFGSGSSSPQTFTIAPAADGVTSVSISNTLGLINLGNPIVYVSSTPVIVPGVPAPLSVTSSVNGVAPFSAGYVFKKGDIPTGSGISITGTDSPNAQAVIKTTWTDGSAKFAVISGTYTSTSGTTSSIIIEAGTSSSGTLLTTTDLQTALTDPVIITAEAFGTVSWSGSDWNSPFETWISGHRMSCWRYRKQIGTDDHLVAWLEVSLFATGQVEILPWIENGYTLVAGPTSKAAVYTFSMGGTERYSGSLDIPHHCRPVLINGSYLAHWLGTDPSYIIRHDTDYMQDTGLVPVYMSKTPDNAAVITSLPTTFSPFSRGSFPVDGLGGVGGNTWVGPLTQWDALYLTNGNATTYKALSINGYAVGRYGLHYREDPTFTNVSDRYKPVRLANHPTLQIRPPDVGWETTPATSGTEPVPFSGDHQPNIGYLAYLVTGRKYHLDTVNFCACANALGAPWPWRESGLGLFKSQQSGAIRQAAWMWRMMLQAATINPDGDTYKTDFETQLVNNINYYHGRYIATAGNQFGFVENYGGYHQNLNGNVGAGATTTVIPVDPPAFVYYGAAQDGQYVGFNIVIGAESRVCTNYVSATNTFTVSPGFSSAPAPGTGIIASDGNYWDAPWMQDYLTAMWGWALDLECGLTGANATKMTALFNWKAQSIVGRLGPAGVGGYNYRDFGPYELPVSPSTIIDWDGGTGPWFSSWADIYATLYSGTAPDGGQPAPYASNGPDTDGALRSGAIVGGNPEASQLAAIAAIAFAAKHNAPGAVAAYQRLTNSPNWQTVVAMLDNNPLWGIGVKATPKWSRGLPIGAWVEIQGSAPSVAPTRSGLITFGGGGSVGGGNSYGARFDAYCGMTLDTRTSTIYGSGGGHGDYYGNELVACDLTKDSPVFIEKAPGTSGQDFPLLSNPTTFIGYTLVGCTTTTIYMWGLNPSFEGEDIVINGETRTISPASVNYQTHSLTLTTPLSNPPAADVVVNLVNPVIHTGFGYLAQTLTRYRDNLPTSRHTYYGQQVIERHNRYVTTNGSISPSGTGADSIEAFDLSYSSNSGWDRFGTYPYLTGGAYGGLTVGIVPSVCKDPTTERIFAIQSQALHVFTPSLTSPDGTVRSGGTYAVTGLPGEFNPGSYTSMTVDTTRNRLIWGHPMAFRSLPLTGGYLPFVEHTLTGNGALIAEFTALGSEGLGLVYVPRTDKFYARSRDAGSKVYVINAATFELTTLSEVGTEFPPASTGSSSPGGHGIYNKWIWVPQLRGIIYMPGAGTNLWFIRLY